MHNELLWAHMPDDDFIETWARRGCGNCATQFCVYPDCLPDAVRDRIRYIADKKARSKLGSEVKTRNDERAKSTDGRTGPDSEALW